MMISTPASAIRMRSRFDDCLMSKLEITRLKNGNGARLIARIATGTTHASAFGHFRMSRTVTATIHPSHALRVYVSSSARCVMATPTMGTILRKS